jgi:hypothetical protein
VKGQRIPIVNQAKPGRRAVTFISALGIIAAGLALRTFGYSLGLPFVAVKYGGSALWAAMVYFLLAPVAPARPALHIALAAITVATGVELFRLVHAPWLDAFRSTTAGALLLGRIFSLWNLVAYVIGIALAAVLDRAVLSDSR